MFCKQCGKPIDDGQELCEDCSKTINENPKNETSTSESVNSENVNNTSSSTVGKSRLLAGLLGIFLGTFGVHNFYLGYTGKAIAQLLISLLSCGILAFASGIWGLVEGIMILSGSITVDGNGNELKD
ncbi:MAG: NINE protein [Clostridiales bacterium]